MPQNLEQQFQAELNRLKHQKRRQWNQKAGIILLIAIVGGWIYSTRNQVPQPPIASSPSPTFTLPEPPFPPVQMPATGTLTPARQSESLGELQIFLTPPTSTEESTLANQCNARSSPENNLNYLIKVIDWQTNQTVVTGFIRAGEKLTLKVPPGTYKLRYASGETWYGEQHNFGSNTRYGEISDLTSAQPSQFKIENTGDRWDLVLQGCYSSNIKTKDLNPKDF